MTHSIKPVVFAVCVASTFGVHTARAEDVYAVQAPPVDPWSRWDDWSWYEEGLESGIGIGINVGGGVQGFSNGSMRDVTSSVGGNWNFRATFGTHIPLAFDATYTGTAQEINSQLGGASTTLIGTTFEGALRLNIFPHLPLCPYVFGGVGWTNWSLNNSAFTLASSGINNNDNVLSVPAGAGLAYRYAGFIGEARGTYRFTFDNDLVLTPLQNNRFASTNWWEAEANIGYEF